ncbi:U-scoloptoxin(16)-Er9a-like [Pollicipes pollicipes]|uniref:U-scoloptoxin(16)-Er9a-like n=1 Tax=Pollicipes pollicipes TaxID=41117 RepID=UPI001884A591|nr:U-scoloptoxin(16)-Er9a-like [Pollicipes pollicipes]
MVVSPLLMVALLASASIAWGYSYTERVAIRPGHKNECWVSTKKRFFANGSSWYEDHKCEKGICREGGTIIVHIGCGLIVYVKGCRVVTPPKSRKLKHPHCCPYVKCP